MPPESSHKPGLAGRNRAAKAFHKDRTAFICRTGREGCGMWGSHSADEPYHLYIASFVWRAAIFFFQYAKHLPCYRGKFRPDLHVIKTTVDMFYKRLLDGLLYFDYSFFIYLHSTFWNNKQGSGSTVLEMTKQLLIIWPSSHWRRIKLRKQESEFN